MLLLLIAVVFAVLKWMDVALVSTLSWWWICLPLALTALWWFVMDATGQTQRLAAQKDELRKKERAARRQAQAFKNRN